MKNIQTVITRIITFGLLSVMSNFASAQLLFDSIPEPLPESSPSLGYQATQTAEFGDYIAFAGTHRGVSLVTVTMNSWACQEGAWHLGTCAYPDLDNLGYMHPITLNIYDVDNSGPVPVIGVLLETITQTFLIPWRPATDPDCPNPEKGYPTGYLPDCNNGFNVNIEFDVSWDLPDEVIYGVAFNTQSWGANLIGVTGPYNSLNFSVPTLGGPWTGTDIDPGALFWNTSTAGWYTDGGAAGVGIFRQDTAWAPWVPAIRFEETSDSDGDGVLDGADLCPETVADVTDKGRLAKNRWIWDGTEWTTNAKGVDKVFTIEETQGCSCNQILDVLVEKTDLPFTGHYNFGCSSSVVEDWISGLYYMETVEVPAGPPSGPVGVDSIMTLKSGVDYQLMASGVADALNSDGSHIPFDAKYSVTTQAPYFEDPDEPTDWTDLVTHYQGFGPELLDLYVDGANIDWGTFNPAHIYWYGIPGTGALLNLWIYDVHYPNNVGSLSVDIFVKLW